MQGVLYLLAGGLADPPAFPCRKLPGLPGQGQGELVLPRRQLPQLISVQVLVGLTQRLPELEQAVHLVRALAHQQVARPRGQRRPAQAADPPGQLPVTGGPGLLGPRVPYGREVTRREGVQLVDDSVQLHSRLPAASPPVPRFWHCSPRMP
ncbi:hypothetical protein [Streptomyces naganishii]|uniref:Uncharacterized protein n=1 Tax=Streptomyces naganishii JCM 4654 TaxID=1306179 RepID=A0A918Y2Q9_9ACTN|nr:hypothetical protein [Streptomyces naganishii]GHD87206.1 hypothetical protein GCM10010508_18420 [Streptomyces naganishii JCM 4654]